MFLKLVFQNILLAPGESPDVRQASRPTSPSREFFLSAFSAISVANLPDLFSAFQHPLVVKLPSAKNQ